ncbi:hypothetical protein [Chryseobacterium sp. MFBS3-17]|uniref:hypothetical protein n=1 Tax=Chryseobacterium sp. MFBS3-17 TaxID=2886689 RepID=UPI001D0EDB8A|nr:hypothetical protein [Chryseobacterium sp. MFBS3-17]MCC2590611.1 hypothetical protein [Chryseobacterium sp. MFBS3-17]
MFNYQSPFADQSLFAQSKGRERLIAFLKANKITDFVYSNVSSFDGVYDLAIRIYGQLNSRDELIFKITTVPLTELPAAGLPAVFNFKELDYLKSSTHFLVYRISDKQWNLCDRTIDNRFVTTFADALVLGRRQFLNDEEFQQIYNEFVQCQSKADMDNLGTRFRNFVQKVNQQLANPFYQNVDLAVNVQLKDNAGNVLKDTTVKTNPKRKVNDIKLQIFLYPDGTYQINHQFSENYLKEFEQKWTTEARKRGLDVDIPEMREDIVAFLNSKEAELSFGKKFLREIRTWYDASVAGYIEGIQATQKITRNIWDVGVINESTWYSKDKDHKEWPAYMQFNPIVGGAVDGVIDEIVGIPMACKSVYEIATDDEKRKALAKVFTSEGFSQMLDGLKESVTELRDDPEKRGHFGGQTAVSVVSMMSGAGLIAKTGKADELVDGFSKVSKKVDDVPNPNFKHLDDVKKSENVIHNPENRKLVNEFMEKQDDVSISDLADEVAENIDLKDEFKVNPTKFIDGKKYEANIKKLIDDNDPDFFNELSAETGIPLSELAGYKKLNQVQIRIPGQNGGFTTMDNVFVKEMTDPVTNKKYLEVIVNECKLSDAAPFTTRQKQFETALGPPPIGKFDLRNIKYQDLPNPTDRIPQNTEIRVKSYVKTVGNGGVNSNFNITKLYP